MLAVDAALASMAIPSSHAEILPANFWHLQQLLRCLHVPMQCPNFNSLRAVSFSAAVMSLSYSTIAIGGAIAIGKQPDAYYNLDRFSTADKVRPAHILLPLSVIKVPSWAACTCQLVPGYSGVEHRSWHDCGALTGVIEERLCRRFSTFSMPSAPSPLRMEAIMWYVFCAPSLTLSQST